MDRASLIHFQDVVTSSNSAIPKIFDPSDSGVLSMSGIGEKKGHMFISQNVNILEEGGLQASQHARPLVGVAPIAITGLEAVIII